MYYINLVLALFFTVTSSLLGGIVKNSPANYSYNGQLEAFPHVVYGEIAGVKKQELLLKSPLVLQNLDGTDIRRFFSLTIPEYNVDTTFEVGKKYLFLVDRLAGPEVPLQIWPSNMSALPLDGIESGDSSITSKVLRSINKTLRESKISEKDQVNILTFCRLFGIADDSLVEQLKLKAGSSNTELVDLAVAILLSLGKEDGLSVYSSLDDSRKNNVMRLLFDKPNKKIEFTFEFASKLYQVSPATTKGRMIKFLSKDVKFPTPAKAAFMLNILKGTESEETYFAACYFIRSLKIEGLLVPSLATFSENKESIIHQIQDAMKQASLTPAPSS